MFRENKENMMGVGRHCVEGSEAVEMKGGEDSEEQEIEKPLILLS